METANIEGYLTGSYRESFTSQRHVFYRPQKVSRNIWLTSHSLASQSQFRSAQSPSPINLSGNCGACGYELNLSSSNRNTATIGSKYGKSIKRGIISFFQIDESRFMKVDEIKCVPYFISKSSWGFFRRRTKLLCRKCGNQVGEAYEDKSCSYPVLPDESSSGEVVTSHRKFDIRIRSLQPSSTDQVGTPLVH